MAAAVAVGAVLLGSTDLAEGMTAGEVRGFRLVAVFAVVLAGLAAYRWRNQLSVRAELESVRRSAEVEVRRAKDQFLANVSHGLRTPLTGIVGFSHLLQQSVRGREDRESVAMILGEAAELSRITDDLLIAARVDADVFHVEPEKVPVLSQVEEVTEFMELLGARVAVDLEEADVVVDPARFRQILRNLLVNAHRHGRPQVTVRGRVRHGRYVCHVIDQGSGVPKEVQSTLFQRFAYRSGEGVRGHVGLGLSVVQELSRLMDVQVSYRRIRGETHFVTSLPLAADTNQSEGSNARRRRVVHSPERVLRHGDRLVRVPG